MEYKIQPFADLSGADLRRTYLHGADLRGADLRSANLSGANLSGADLSNAYLSGADLTGADLSYADLHQAYMSGADLSYADLTGVNLTGAYLSGANLPPLAAAVTEIVPRDGEVIGWKKCRRNVLVKIRVPPEAKRSNATGRKCRAEFVEVLEVVGADEAISQHDPETIYRVGEIVKCDNWCEDRWEECAGGIHFFITREEAEAYF